MAKPARAPRPKPPPARRLLGLGGLGVAAAAYVSVDYLRHLSPAWHGRLQPALWAALALAAAARAPVYRHWSAELRAALPFLGSIAFMLAAFLCEAISVRFVSAVMGLHWHRSLLLLVLPSPGTGPRLAWRRLLSPSDALLLWGLRRPGSLRGFDFCELQILSPCDRSCECARMWS
jgi:hypothetical protein